MSSGSSDDQRFRKRRRRPQGRRSAHALRTDAAEAHASRRRFDDPSLQALHERGRLAELLAEVKSGKEATVYLGRAPAPIATPETEASDGPAPGSERSGTGENDIGKNDSGENGAGSREPGAAADAGLVAVKLYHDAASGARDDARVWEGRRIGDARIKRTFAQGRRLGIPPQLAHWVFHEYEMLWRLHRAGLPVPRPLVGPDGADIAAAGRVVLMQWLGDAEAPAPRLADVRLEADAAAEVWRQAQALLRELLSLGLVHGDLSAYNLLWWRERVWLIDLPQMVPLAANRHARDFLERDVESLCRSFRQPGVRPDPEALLAELLPAAAAGRRDAGR